MLGSNRAVFLDRDGTIVHDPGYISRPDQLSLIDGAADAIARLRQAGFLVILATNQSAIARGMMTEEDLAAVHARLGQLLAAANPGAKLDAIYYCPFHPEAKIAAYKQESYLRKPRPGMLFKAAREHQLDLGSCWMVGDSERDVQAGKTAGCRAIRVAPDPETDTMADKVLASLSDAAELILASPGRTPLRTPRPAEAPVEPAPAIQPPPLPQAQVVPTADASTRGEVAALAGPAVHGQDSHTTAPAPRPEPAPVEVIAADTAEVAARPAADAQGLSQSAETQAAGEQQAVSPQPGRPSNDIISSQPDKPSENSIPAQTSQPTEGIPLPDKPNLGKTKERLLRQIEEDRKKAAAAPDHPVDSLTADKPIRALDTGNMRHVLAEILQQVRQLNRGPAKAERSASKMLGGLFQAASWGLFAGSVISMFSEGPGPRSITWALLGVFMQVASLFFFTMFKTE